MRLIAPLSAVAALILSSSAIGAPNEGTSLGLRAGQLTVSGDVEDATGTVWGFSMVGISPKSFDFAWGTHFHIGVDMLFGNFDYEGTDWPFESEKQTEFSVFTIAPGVTFFGELPVQLQLGLPITKLDLDQTDKYHQSYGTDGYLARIGRLIAPNFTVSVEYETHTVRQVVAEDEYSMQFDLMSATVGWVPGND